LSTPGPYCLGVQRLFSTFPNSWPGAGLLILRLAAGSCLVEVGTIPGDLGDSAALLLRCASLVVAILLLVGLTTPFAGVCDAAIQVGIMILDKRYGSSSMAAAALGLALAMLGPGAWSLDARVFGRKRIV
jgi:putative oxidoreductase